MGEINPQTLKFIPDMQIQGMEFVSPQQALQHKICCMNYKLKIPPLVCLGENSTLGEIRFGFRETLETLDDRNIPSVNFAAKQIAIQ